MEFTSIKAENSLKDFYETIINPKCINHVYQSASAQAGNSIIVLAVRPAKPAAKHSIATIDSLTDLEARFPHLIPVEFYGTASGKSAGPGLVNLGSVVEIDNSRNKDFIVLYFADGTDVAVTPEFQATLSLHMRD